MASLTLNEIGYKFFGIKQDRVGKITYQDSFYEFIGWQRKASSWRKALNTVKAVTWVIPIKLLLLPLNLLKVFTELLPDLAAHFFEDQAKKLANKILRDHIHNRVTILTRLAYVPLVACKIANVICRLISFVGHAITSPITQIRDIIKNEHLSTKKKIILVTLSAAISITAYLTLPVLAKSLFVSYVAPFIANHVAPFLATHLPTVLQAANSCIQAISNSAWLAQVGSLVIPAIKGIGLAALSPPVTGLIFLTGIAITTIGVQISKFKQMLSESWEQSKRKTDPFFLTMVKNNMMEEARNIIGGIKSFCRWERSKRKNLREVTNADRDDSSRNSPMPTDSTPPSITSQGKAIEQELIRNIMPTPSAPPAPVPSAPPAPVPSAPPAPVVSTNPNSFHYQQPESQLPKNDGTNKDELRIGEPDPDPVLYQNSSNNSLTGTG